MMPDVTMCKRCDSTNLTVEKGLLCEDTWTNAEVVRDVVMCKDCECIHYLKEDGTFVYEFHSRPIDYAKFLMADATNYAVALAKKSVNPN